MELQSVALAERTELPNLRPAKVRTESPSAFFEMLSARNAGEPMQSMVTAALPFDSVEPSIPTGSDRLHEELSPARMPFDDHPTFNDRKDVSSQDSDAQAAREEADRVATARREERAEEERATEEKHRKATEDASRSHTTNEESNQAADANSVAGRTKKTAGESAAEEANTEANTEAAEEAIQKKAANTETGETHVKPAAQSVAGGPASAQAEKAARTIEALVGSLSGTLRGETTKEAVAKASTGKGSNFQVIDAEARESISEVSGRSQQARKQGAAPDAASLQSGMRDRKADKSTDFADASLATGVAGRTKIDSEIQLGHIVTASVDAKADLKDRVILDSDKWNVVSTKPSRREMPKSENQDSGKGESQRDFKEPGLRFDTLKALERPATAQELEKGVRSGLNELVKKANVQIGQQGNASAQIRMNPDHLGFMSVDMKVEQNRVVLKILVDREDVLEQLKKDLDVLRAEFGKSGLQIDSLSLKLRESFNTAFQSDTQDGKDFSFQGSDDQRRDERAQDRQDSASGYFESAFTTPEIEAIEPSRNEAIRPTHRERGQAGYESQLVMNFHQSTDHRSFRA